MSESCHCSTVWDVVASPTLRKCRDVVRRRATRISEVTPGTVVEDHKVDPLLDTLHKMDLETEQLGLRAFVWNIERTI